MYFGTTYYWRASAKSAVDTSSWSAAWNFTTANSITNVTPSNGATNVSINPLLDWNPLTGNDGYLCEIDTSPNFNSGLHQILTSAINSSQINASGLMYGTTYYWHAAIKDAVDTSDWSLSWKFTTAYELTVAPTLVSPANNSIDLSYTSVGIEWASSAGAVNYQYQYSTDISFNTGTYSNNTSLITGNISGLYPHTIYYWRVRGMNANGYSPWSTTWQFTTQSAVLTAPILVSPVNNSTGVDYNSVTLDWNLVYGASKYIYEISPDSTFTTGVTTDSLNFTEKSFIGLATNTQYFWRIKASDGAVESNWSEVWNFRTMFPVGISELENQFIKIYPNPASEQLTMSTSLRGTKLSFQFFIYDLSGKEIYKAELKESMQTIDISDIKSGVYVLQVISGKDLILRKQIIKL